MAIDPIHAFYCRKAYLDLAQKCKIKSGGICAKCGDVFDKDELRPHHKIEVTLENVDDASIVLNEDNIEVLCHNCHNLTHARFGNTVGLKHVYLVYGAPLAGKVDYVANVATNNDLIVNLDKIHQSICICGMYNKPQATKKIAFNIRDYLLDEIKTATPHRKWQDAYVIGTYPERYDRDNFVNNYADCGVELVHIATPKEDCIKKACEIKQPSIREAVIGWINNYFERYTE